MKTARLLTVLTAALCLSLAFSQETITFTNCGQGGRNGPSQNQCNNTYNGTSLDGVVTVTFNRNVLSLTTLILCAIILIR